MNETFSLNMEVDKISFQKAREIVTAILEKGNSVELAATGYSMFPTFRPGDRITIKPLDESDPPEPGNVVVYEENSIFVMHRLIEIRIDDQGNPQIVTRGDSLNKTDKHWPWQQLLGVAVSYKRSGKEHLIKNFIPGAWRYKYYRRLLWMFGKIKKLSMEPGKLLKSK